MADAVATVKGIRSSKNEFDSRSVSPAQAEPIKMPSLHEKVARENEVVLPLDRPLDKNQLDALAFAEEPITILIHRSVDKNANMTTDYIAINGIAAEMLFKNGWVPMGYLPKGVSFITKRKYVEQLARAKFDQVSTTVIERDNEDPQNFVERVTSSVMAFSVLEDANPKGAEWLTRLISSR